MHKCNLHLQMSNQKDPELQLLHSSSTLAVTITTNYLHTSTSPKDENKKAS